MSNLIQLLQENQKLKYQLEKLKSSNGLLPYIDDSVIKGGYHVVKNITERDAIDCCYRKLGMKVLVIGEDFSFKEYVLKSNNCKENIWQKRNTITEEDDVTLVEDYSELEENLTTQKELNLVLKQLILNLQTQIDNIELIDEKVQITEATDFAQIGESQKDFNKNVSDYKVIIDDKNIEQDDRLENLESENVNQYDLINDLQTSLNNKLDKGTYTSTAQDLKNDIDSKANISHTHDISDVTNLQTTLNNKLDKGSLTSNDDSLLVEGENIEVQLSIYSEEFEQKIFNLTFTPINILGVYKNGIYLRSSEFILNLPKSITINNYNTNDIVIVQYQHLKTDI